MVTSSTKLWVASGNPRKTKELVDFTSEFFPNAKVYIREPKGVVENKNTFEGNARLKTNTLAQELTTEGHRNFYVLGDDSGLCVDLLEGRPGIFSGRYSGAGQNSLGNLQKVLDELNAITRNLKERTAQYRCALCLIEVSSGRVTNEISAEGVREGLIGLSPQGINGYAYDSVFLDPATLLSYGEIPYEKKQLDSHRRRAFEKIKGHPEIRL